MTTEYDATIRRHYDQVAEESGLSLRSTMGDEIIRAKEMQTILNFVEGVAGVRSAGAKIGGDKGLVVLDVGCGNGYSLRRLIEKFPQYRYVGVEHNEKMRKLAEIQVASAPSVQILPGDLRDPGSIALERESADIVVCQRVLINLMDPADQKKGLDTIVRLVRPGGAVLFIEAFSSGLQNLNSARGEFGVAPIPPALHNLYLPDEFFEHPALRRLPRETFDVPPNLLSTHYFVSRVLHEVATRGMNQGFVRNSHFVKFFSEALPDAVGDYAPLRIKAFQKAESTDVASNR